MGVIIHSKSGGQIHYATTPLQRAPDSPVLGKSRASGTADCKVYEMAPFVLLKLARAGSFRGGILSLLLCSEQEFQ